MDVVDPTDAIITVGGDGTVSEVIISSDFHVFYFVLNLTYPCEPQNLTAVTLVHIYGITSLCCLLCCIFPMVSVIPLPLPPLSTC